MSNTRIALDTDVKFDFYCKPFSAYGTGPWPVMVTFCPRKKPVVRVYDSIACHYTLMHALTPSAERRIVAHARKVAADDAR